MDAAISPIPTFWPMALAIWPIIMAFSPIIAADAVGTGTAPVVAAATVYLARIDWAFFSVLISVIVFSFFFCLMFPVIMIKTAVICLLQGKYGVDILFLKIFSVSMGTVTRSKKPSILTFISCHSG